MPTATSAGKSSFGMKFFRRSSSGSMPELGGELLDHHLDQVGRLRPPGAADGVGRHLVREDPGDVGLDGRDLVATAHHERRERRDERREQLVVGAHVGEDLRVQGGDRAVALRAHPHVVDLVAPVRGHLHVLRARRGPAHRPLEPARQVRDERLLAVDVQLRAEAAADVGRDHAEVVLRDAEHAGELEPHEVRDLRRRSTASGGRRASPPPRRAARWPRPRCGG